MRSFLLLASLLLLTPSISLATEDTRPQLHNSPMLATPEALKTNPFSGAAVFAYPFDLPKGTGGLTPRLVLSNSTATRNTEYGYGWSLSLGKIERSTRFGAPDYLDPATPVDFDSATGQENPRHRFELDGEILVRDPSTANRFHKRAADGTRILFVDQPAGNGFWEVTQPNGTRFRYGSRATASSELARSPSGTGTQVFRWALDEVIDARGNAYRIDYEEDTHQITGNTFALYTYPREITYSYHHDATEVDDSRALRRVVLEWQGRGDPGFAYNPLDLNAPSADRPTSYRSGFKVQRRKRLAEIRVELTNGQLIRRYEFQYAHKIGHAFDGAGAYDFHGDVFRPNSELIAIQRYGRDGSEFPSKTTFDYTVADNDFQPAVSVPGTDGPIRVTHSMYSVGDTPVDQAFYDFDGDGFLDLSPRRLGGGGGPPFVGFGVKPTPFPSDYSAAWNNPPLFRDVFDWNSPPRGIDFGLSSDMIDLDGDGRVDRVEYRDCDDDGDPFFWDFCWLRNNGAGFDPPKVWPGIEHPLSLGWTTRTIFVGDEEYSTTQATIDLNGDGLPDWAGEQGAFLNTGTRFDSSAGFPGFNGAVMTGTTRSLPSLSHLDINGDGLPDRHVWTVCLGGGSTYFNLGDRFQQDGGTDHEAYEGDCTTPVTAVPASPETGLFGGTYSTLVDMNGDGVLDLVTANTWAAFQPFDPSGPHWNVYYGLGDGRYLTDPTALRGEGSLVDVTGGVDGYVGHHWSIPGFRVPEMIEIGQGGSPPPSTVTAAYWIRYTNSAGPPAQQWNGSISDLVDLTGDGLPDYVSQGDVSSLFKWTVWINGGPSGLLETVTNELGGTTDIHYLAGPQAARLGTAAVALSYPEAPSAEDHSGSDVAERAIAGTWVVTRVEVSDGRSDNFAVDLSESVAYSGPRFDTLLRENLGYRMVEQIDPLGSYKRSLFHQTPELRGRLQATEDVGLFSTLVRSRETTWTAIPTASMTASGPAGIPASGSYFAAASGEQLRLYDPQDSSAYVERTITRTHDPATGNVLTQVEAGHGAELTRGFEYLENWQDWLVSFPRSVELTLGNGGNPTDGPRFAYLYDGSSTTTPPTEGLVTERHTLHDGDHAGDYRIERWAYDPFGNQIAFFDGNAAAAGSPTPTRTTTWEAGWSTFPATITDALGDTTTLSFDQPFGRVATLIDPAGFLRCSEFDSFGRLAWLRRRSKPVYGPAHCDQDLANFSYWSIGDPEQQQILTSTFYQRNRQALWGIELFDGLGRVYKQLQHAGGTHEAGDVDYFITLAGWDRRGNRACASLPMRGQLSTATNYCWAFGRRRVALFDSLSRQLATYLLDPATFTVEESVRLGIEDLDGDSYPDLVAEITTEGEPDRVIKQGRDAWNRLVATVADPSGDRHRIEFLRDDLRRIVGLREFADTTSISQTEIAYFQSGERKSLTPPGLAPGWSYEYDDSGNMILQTSRSLEVSLFSYDAAGQLLVRDVEPYLSEVGFLSRGDARFQYEAGRLIRESTASLESTFEYHLNGDLFHEARTYEEGLDLTFGATHLYDLMGRRTLSIVPGNVWPVRHYDGTLLAGVEHFYDGIDFVARDLEYHASGALEQIVYPSFGAESLTGHYSYASSTHRLGSTRVQSSGGTIFRDQLYDYDTAGNLQTVDDTLLGKLSQQFRHDALFRLQSTTVSGTHASLFDAIATGAGRSFAYSPSGNLSNKGDLALEYGSQTSGVAGPHAVMSVRDATLSLVGSYGYDANGAVTSLTRSAGATTLALARDGNGWLTTACPDPSCTPSEAEDTHYRYAANGRRVRKFQGSALDQLSPFRWLDVDLVAGTHELHYFVRGRRIATVERTGLGSEGSSGNAFASARYYHPDPVGSNSLVTDSSGAVRQETVLDPFGELLGTPQGSGAENVYLLTDKQRDDETGLYSFGARYYDPWVGRFVSADPELVGAIDPRISLTAAELLAGLPVARALARTRPGDRALWASFAGTADGFGLASARARLSGLPTVQRSGITLARLGFDPQQANEYSYVANRPMTFVDVGGRALGGLAGSLIGGVVGGLGGAGVKLGRGMFRQATRGDGDISFGTLSKGFRDGFLLGAATGLLAGSAIDPASGLILAAAAWHGGILAGAIAGTVDAANSDCDCIVNIIDLPSPEPSLP